MGYVCAIAGGKGGVGKTTTAINLAVVAAEHRDVALLDADLGMANVGAVLGVDSGGSLHDVLAGESTLADVIVDREEGPAVVVGDRNLDAYAEADPAELRGVIESLRAEYDLVVVDTGAGLSHDALVPLGLADGVVMATTPDDVAVRDTRKTADLAGRVDGSILGAVVTRATPDTDVDAVAAALPFPVVGVVPEDPDETGNAPVVRRSPDAPAAAAYRRLTDGLERVFFEGATGEDLADAWEAPTAQSSETDVAANTAAVDATDAPAATDGDAPESTDSGERGDADTPAEAGADDGDEDASVDGGADDDAESGGVFGLFR